MKLDSAVLKVEDFLEKRRNMKKFIVSLTFVAVALTAACSGVSDADMQKQVGDKIHADPSLKTVSVMVKDGNVTLAGEVDSQTQMKLAESMAKQIDGVKKLDNKIVIKSDSGSTITPSTTSPMSPMSNSNSMTNSNMSNK